MEPICEAKFSENSNGFRPNRSAETAIAQCCRLIQVQHLYHVVDLDIKGFFDNINHTKLIRQIWSLGIRDKKEVKKLEHSADDKAQFMQLMTYNAVVAGIHQYYCIATAVSEDFGKLAYGFKKQMHNRLRNDLTRKGELKKGYIKEKYGKSSQLRFLHGRPVVPIGYVQSRNAQHKRKSVNKYTPEGRELIHKNLNIDTKTMLWLMRNPVQGRSIEYADNRISLYAAQHGKCAVTGSIMEAHEIHCHHRKPIAKGGTDEYGNLVLISAPVHKLIHASDMATIKFYLNLLNLDSTQILKLNKFREMAEMPLID